MRTYELYGETPTGPFTVQSVAYSRGTHPHIVTVRAKSVKQAYYLAGNRQWADGENEVGITAVESNAGSQTIPQTQKLQTS